MKKIIILLSILLLAGCGSTQTVKTVTVDKDGNVIKTETKVEEELTVVASLSMPQMVDPDIFQSTTTGCKYIQYGHSLSPLYDEYGQVAGCKKNKIPVQP